jgi:hypothetical protein
MTALLTTRQLAAYLGVHVNAATAWRRCSSRPAGCWPPAAPPSPAAQLDVERLARAITGHLDEEHHRIGNLLLPSCVGEIAGRYARLTSPTAEEA